MSSERKILHGAFLSAALVFGPALQASAEAVPSLTLQEAITEAQKHHPQADIAGASVDTARGALKSARSALFPSLSVGEDFLYSNDPVFAFGSKLRQARFASNDFGLDALNHPSPLSNFSASASATWTAFDGGSTRHSVLAAEASLHASQLSAQYTAERIGAQVTALYYRALTAEDQVVVARSIVTRAREIDESVQDRMRAGLALESDGARAHLALQSAEDDLASAQDNVLLARRDLFAEIGRASSDQPLSRADAHPAQAPESAQPATDPQQRADIQAFQYQRQAAIQSLSAAQAMVWPQVTALARVENDAQTVVTNGSGNWTVGGKVQWNVFDGGSRRSRELQAAAQVRAVEAQRKVALLEADSTIASLKYTIEDLTRRLATADEAIRTQAESLQTARDRYNTGLLTITDVLDRENALSEAQFQRVQTFYKIRIANANLALASGAAVKPKAGQP